MRKDNVTGRLASRCPVIVTGLMLVGVLVLSGCTTPDKPSWSAADKANPHVFQVARHGWHVGLVVARQPLTALAPELGREFPRATFFEIGWGDARFYQTDDPSVGLALRAALWPTDSVLHIVGFSMAPEKFFPASEVIPVCVGPTGHERLLTYITETFARDGQGRIQLLGAGLYGNSRFYRAQGTFHLFNNCNTWSARAVGATGLPVSSGMTLTAGGVVSQLRHNGQNVYPCP